MSLRGGEGGAGAGTVGGRHHEELQKERLLAKRHELCPQPLQAAPQVLDNIKLAATHKGFSLICSSGSRKARWSSDCFTARTQARGTPCSQISRQSRRQQVGWLGSRLGEACRLSSSVVAAAPAIHSMKVPARFRWYRASGPCDSRNGHPCWPPQPRSTTSRQTPSKAGVRLQLKGTANSSQGQVDVRPANARPASSGTGLGTQWSWRWPPGPAPCGIARSWAAAGRRDSRQGFRGQRTSIGWPARAGSGWHTQLAPNQPCAR